MRRISAKLLSSQPLDLSLKKLAKALISIKYKSWFSKQISAQLALETELSKIKVSAKLSDIKPLHSQWVVDICNYMCEEKNMNINGFKSAVVTEAIQSAQEIVIKAGNK